MKIRLLSICILLLLAFSLKAQQMSYYYNGQRINLEVDRSMVNIVAIHPNPTTGMIYFDNPDGNTISIYDELGKLLQTTTSNCFDFSKYPNGNYYLKINNQAIKIIKQSK